MDIGGIFSSLIGIIIFVASVWAIARIINSTATTGMKVLWIALILILPVVGLIIWYFAGPK